MKRTNRFWLLKSAALIVALSAPISAQGTRCGLQPIKSDGEIVGRVLFEYNKLLFTLSDAKVTIYHWEPSNGAGAADVAVEATSDSAGRFHFEGLKPGNYVISIETILIPTLQVGLNVTTASSDGVQDKEVVFVLGSDGRHECGGGYLRTVKTFDSRPLKGASAIEPWIQIDEITLEHTGCFGSCPIYKVILRRDGFASYTGKDYAERKGSYHAKLDRLPFENLAQLIYGDGFFNMRDRYEAPFTDLDTMIITVLRNGKRKTVEAYGGSYPIELWGMAIAIDAIADEMKWIPDQGTPARPRRFPQ